MKSNSCSLNRQPKLYVHCIVVLVLDCLAPKHAETLSTPQSSTWTAALRLKWRMRCLARKVSGRHDWKIRAAQSLCDHGPSKHEQTWTNIWAPCKSWGETRLLSHILAELSSWIETEKHEAVRPVVPYKALSPPTWLAMKPAAAAQRSTFSTFHTLEVSVLVPSWLQSIVSFALQVCVMFVTAISSKTGLLVESTARETRSNIAANYFMFKSCFVQAVATATKFGCHYSARNSCRKEKERREQGLSC